VVGAIPALPSSDGPFIDIKDSGDLAARQTPAQTFRAESIGDGPWLRPRLSTQKADDRWKEAAGRHVPTTLPVENGPGVSAEDLGGRIQSQAQLLTPASEHRANVGDLICPTIGLRRDAFADWRTGRAGHEIGDPSPIFQSMRFASGFPPPEC
jgi:hypothetical protein